MIVQPVYRKTCPCATNAGIARRSRLRTHALQPRLVRGDRAQDFIQRFRQTKTSLTAKPIHNKVKKIVSLFSSIYRHTPRKPLAALSTLEPGANSRSHQKGLTNMSTPAQITANIANAQSSCGPASEADKAASSRNGVAHRLLAVRDFIRPGEFDEYTELTESLHADLAPVGALEATLSEEIRCATWRLRRCRKVEANLAIGLDDGGGFIFDPMETPNRAAEKTQQMVDRARAQAHRLLHKCTAELRKLQTERQYRNESFEAGTDLSHLGVCDWPSIEKALHRSIIDEQRRQKQTETDELDALLNAPVPSSPAHSGSFCKNAETPAVTPRNAPCPCGSGQQYTVCCAQKDGLTSPLRAKSAGDAPAVPHAA